MRDMQTLCANSNRLRSAKAQFRAGLASGELALADVLADPPDCLQQTILLDLLRMARGIGATKLRLLNLRAMRDRVNLATPLGQTSERSRRWLADELSGAHRRPKTAGGGIASGSRPDASPPKEPLPPPDAPPVADFTPRRRVGHARAPRRLSGTLIA